MISINGEKYLTVKEFANITMRTEQNVRFLMSKGNKMRKLKSMSLAGKILIPASEVIDYPFTSAGRNPQVYHYEFNESGKSEASVTIEGNNK